MNYVMVPVPEEFAAELQQELMKMALRDSMNGWTEDRLLRLVGELSDPWRRLLQELLRGPQTGARRSMASVAAALDVTEHEALHQARAINDLCSARGWPTVVMSGTRIDPEGDLEVRTLYLVASATDVLDRVIGEHAQPS